jgi:hypothetical protein
MNRIAELSCELHSGCCTGVREWYLLLYSRNTLQPLVEARHAHSVTIYPSIQNCPCLFVSRLPSAPIGRRRELLCMGRCRPIHWWLHWKKKCYAECVSWWLQDSRLSASQDSRCGSHIANRAHVTRLHMLNQALNHVLPGDCRTAWLAAAVPSARTVSPG